MCPSRLQPRIFRWHRFGVSVLRSLSSGMFWEILLDSLMTLEGVRTRKVSEVRLAVSEAASWGNLPRWKISREHRFGAWKGSSGNCSVGLEIFRWVRAEDCTTCIPDSGSIAKVVAYVRKNVKKVLHCSMLSLICFRHVSPDQLLTLMHHMGQTSYLNASAAVSGIPRRGLGKLRRE